MTPARPRTGPVGVRVQETRARRTAGAEERGERRQMQMIALDPGEVGRRAGERGEKRRCR